MGLHQLINKVKIIAEELEKFKQNSLLLNIHNTIDSFIDTGLSGEIKIEGTGISMIPYNDELRSAVEEVISKSMDLLPFGWKLFYDVRFY